MHHNFLSAEENEHGLQKPLYISIKYSNKKYLTKINITHTTSETKVPKMYLADAVQYTKYRNDRWYLAEVEVCWVIAAQVLSVVQSMSAGHTPAFLDTAAENVQQLPFRVSARVSHTTMLSGVIPPTLPPTIHNWLPIPAVSLVKKAAWAKSCNSLTDSCKFPIKTWGLKIYNFPLNSPQNMRFTAPYSVYLKQNFEKFFFSTD